MAFKLIESAQQRWRAVVAEPFEHVNPARFTAVFLRLAVSGQAIPHDLLPICEMG